MVTQQQVQPVQVRPIALKPVTVKRTSPASRLPGKGAADRLMTQIALYIRSLDVPGWLRGETPLPAWQIVLTASLIIMVSAAVPAMSLRHPSHSGTTAGGGMPIVSDSLPVDLPVPASSTIVQAPDANVVPEQQILGLHDSTQELLKQIQQAQHDNAELRTQLQAQNQSLGATQSEAAATDAEQTTQQQQLQSQTNAAIQSATAQLSQLSTSVTALDDQASLLRKTLGMGQTTYPSITIPDLTKAADPQQAFDAALTSIEAHVTAVSTDLATIKSTAQKQLAFAQSVAAQSVATGSQSQVHGSGVFIWPTTGTITQNYGPTDLTLEPSYGGYAHFHLGVDIANSQGTPIAAAAAGTVIYAGWTDAGYGNMVEIDHGNGLVTIYGHMMTTPVVKVGQTVFQGQLIGYMGTTGNSTGPHLHFGVQKNGSWDNPFNYLP
jgi:murein DD-endopeptidase MepM/ murein hydrolase activator NlpD